MAVATGVRSRAELEGLEPDLMLDDLTDREALIAWARGVAARA